MQEQTVWILHDDGRSQQSQFAGVAKVLSQTLRIRRWRASCATAARSITFSMGLVGDSIHTMRVFGRIAAWKASGFVRSTKLTSSPAVRLRIFSNNR